MIIDRALKAKLKQLFLDFPAIAILGPRQSGKTTIAKQTFSNLPYKNLEDL
jgi:predicted AAA+ superfamily ATPase